MPKRLTTERFIEKAESIHGNRYNYSLVNYINAITKVKITCKEHGLFEQKPKIHLEGSGCKICSSHSSTSEFVDKSVIVHGNKYDYSKVNYVNSKTKVKIICKEHGEFLQTPASHLAFSGCKMCHFFKKKLTKEQFIYKSNKVHKNKFNYSLVKYKNANSTVLIICNIHGIFAQTPGSHMAGHGCKKCNDDAKKSSTEEFIKISEKIHGNKYNYSLVNYVNNYTKVIIICSKHGEFNQKPRSHLSGENCNKCKISKGEIKIINFLKQHILSHESQYKFNDCKNINKLPFDVYLPEHNICVEYDGIQHFETMEIWGGKKRFKETQKNDQIKTDYCLINNIKLIRIPYWDFKNIEEILEKELNITLSQKLIY